MPQKLQSIYPESISTRSTSTPGELVVDLELSIDLDSDCDVLVVDNTSLQQGNSHNGLSSFDSPESSGRSPIPLVTKPQPTKLQTLSHLPPIHVSLTLPATYPLYDPPTVESIISTHSWLSDHLLMTFKMIILRLWEDCHLNEEGILSRLFELTTQDYGLLRKLGILEYSGKPRIRIQHANPRLLVPLLESHNTLAKSKQFEQESFHCPICLTTLKGVRCLRIRSCGHVCCRACLKEFWEMSIRQGEVGVVGCVDEECVKAGAKTKDILWSSVSEDEVKLIVGEELTARWKQLRHKRLVEKDPTIVICPIPICQAPVFKPPLVTDDEDEDAGWNRLRSCQACSYSFCVLCRRTWHGPLSSCETNLKAELIESYLAMEPDSAGRREIESRYGRSYFQKLIAAYQEAKLNKEWMDKSTMACPGCNTRVEKSAGCNH
ncbi:translation termination inhibitor protein itt1, partial [Tulasnella sp. 418]